VICGDCWAKVAPPAATLGAAVPAALVVLLLSVAAAGGIAWSQHRLQKLPRALQSASDWMEESAAQDQVRSLLICYIIHSI